MRRLLPLCSSAFLLLGSAASAGEAPARGKGAALAPKSLQKLYESWFEKPYEYMFERGANKLTVGQQDLGTFRGGIRGIVNYGSLIDAAAKVAGLPSPGFGDVKPIERLARLAVYAQQDTTGMTYSQFNPALIRWGHQNLIPKPQQKLLNQSYRVVYEKIFSRFFRLMTESYLHLEKGKLWDKEVAAYKQAIKLKRAGLPYLHQRYAGLLSHYKLPRDGTSFTPPMAFGFWVRRKMDGTAGELWTGLGKLMASYDSAYFSKLKR
jgi:hypothetical protein